MTKASGRKAHSNGADFEKYLEDVVFKAALDSGYFKRIDKLNPTYVAVRNRAGVTFRATEQSGVDWIAMGGEDCPWSYIAMEAKHSETRTLAQSRIKPHQIAHLDTTTERGLRVSRQVGVLLVSFNHNRGRSVFALRWTNVLFKKRGSGYSLAMEDCDIRDEITPYRTLNQVMYGWPHRA